MDNEKRSQLRWAASHIDSLLEEIGVVRDEYARPGNDSLWDCVNTCLIAHHYLPLLLERDVDERDYQGMAEFLRPWSSDRFNWALEIQSLKATLIAGAQEGEREDELIRLAMQNYQHTTNPDFLMQAVDHGYQLIQKFVHEHPETSAKHFAERFTHHTLGVAQQLGMTMETIGQDSELLYAATATWNNLCLGREFLRQPVEAATPWVQLLETYRPQLTTYPLFSVVQLAQALPEMDDDRTCPIVDQLMVRSRFIFQESLKRESVHPAAGSGAPAMTH